MASFNENDEIPMLPISDSSRSLPSTNRSHSLSIPSSSIEGFNNFQKASGCSGPLRTRRLHSSVQLTTPMEPSDSTSGVSSQPERYPSFDSLERKPSNEDESVEFHDGRSWARRNASSLTTFFAFSCLLAIFIDPLFFFIISFNKNNKCMVIDWSMTHGFLAVRTLTDFIFFLNIGLQFWLAYVAHERRGGGGELVDQSKKVVVLNFILDLFIVLPLPQILILVVIPKTLHKSEANHAKNVLGTAVLLQYIPKLYRVVPMLVGKTHTHFIVESAWANFVINLLTFMLAGHVVGSCWYFFGLRRVNQCLREACDSPAYICRLFIDCGHEKSNTILGFQSQPDMWSKNSNATACFEEDRFPYGIYLKAVKLTSNSNILTRYIYSLFWGFQQISTLAGNLVPSHNIGEVLFTMGIIGLGLLLFALLIGNMQNFIQALGKRRFEMTLRRRDVEQWMSHRKLPKDIRKRVVEAERFNWATARGVNEDLIFENMPEDLQRDIRRHLFKFLTKLKMFSSMNDTILDAIRERLKQRTYIKGSIVLHRRCIVDKLVFIVRGEMQSIEENGSKVSLLSEGDVCGEELLTWCLERCDVNPADGTKIKISPNSKVLLSKRVVTCLTDVEAFSLSVADLEDVMNLYSKFLKNPPPPVQGPIRNESLNWKHRGAMKIQVAWRNRKKGLHQRLCTGSL